MPEAVVEPVVEIVARGPHAEATRGYAEKKVRRVMAAAGAPVLFGRITLDEAPDPAVERSALAQAMLDVNGRPVRAQVAAHEMTEAVDLLEARLRDRLAHRAAQLRTVRRRGAATVPGEWRHGQAEPARPAWFDRPADERQVVRRKTFALDELTAEEAAFDMEMLDYDFYLFRELGTGRDAVLHRMPDGGHAVVRPTPGLVLDEAIERLVVGGEPFVAYVDRDSGRANVVYRRYDGHHGLITSADEPVSPAEPATARRRLRDELDRLEAVRAALAAEELDKESARESVGEMSAVDQHPADLGTETFERERDLSLLGDVDQEIADVRRSLVRVDRGTYGQCEACGQQIPDERLVAVPATRFCVEHQATSEVIPGVEPRRRVS
ncbi:MAG TPA: sigma 54 modulation/S30EA ribosomal C-terminal domain-containing protein [Acidimicrobiales bacterium]